MADNFYDKQINRIEANDKLREYDWLINDYLKATSIEEVKIIKDLIIKKALSELNFKELTAFKDTLSERWQNEVWKNKMKLYELVSWLYNNTPLTNIPNQNQPIQAIQPSNQENYSETLPPFEVAWWRITKRVLGLDWIKEKTYDIVWADSEYIWNWKYRIYLESSRKVGKYGRSSQNDSIVIWYRWWNTIQIFDSEWERRIWIVNIKNNMDIYESGRLWNWRYDRRIEQRNSMVSFELKEYWSKIELFLTFPWR
jgi:hypothetical protein